MRLNKDAEKLFIGSFIPRVDRDRVLLRCLLLQNMGYGDCATPNTSACVRSIGVAV